jgi:hypothetical protein
MFWLVDCTIHFSDGFQRMEQVPRHDPAARPARETGCDDGNQAAYYADKVERGPPDFDQADMAMLLDADISVVAHALSPINRTSLQRLRTTAYERRLFDDDDITP